MPSFERCRIHGQSNLRTFADGWRVLKAAEPMARRVDEKLLEVLPATQRERFLQDLAMIVAELSKLSPVDDKTGPQA